MWENIRVYSSWFESTGFARPHHEEWGRLQNLLGIKREQFPAQPFSHLLDQPKPVHSAP
jgi:hypothetical protein